MITDIRTYGAVADASTNCSTAINTALLAGDIIIQNGIFQIETPILIPSNRTIYIKNAKIILRSNYHDNMFRNADFNNGNSNIQIIGQGNASICGNSAGHNDGYTTYGQGTSSTYRYYVGVFVNVSGFEISGIAFSDNPHWGIYLQGCSGYTSSNSKIKNCVCNIYNLRANQDFVDIGWGTHNVDFDNITVHTIDDPFGLFVSNLPDMWVVTPSTPSGKRGAGDVYNISYSNIYIKYTFYHPFITLTGDGNKIHDISFSNITVLSCQFLCYFGLSGYYNVAPTVNDCYNLTFDHVTIQSQADTQGVIKVLENCKDITFTNFTNNTGKQTYYVAPGKTGQNISINGVLQ